MKRNKFFTFLFSLIPGAGHMYYGFYKQGIQLMSIFIGIYAIATFFNLNLLLFALPVIWFFSFFHINNLSKLSQEELYAHKDNWLIPESFDLNIKPINFSPTIALIMLCVGIFLLLRNLVDIFGYILPEQIKDLLQFATWRLPQTFLSIIIIYAAMRMIKNKKNELESNKDEYKELFKQDDWE